MEQRCLLTTTINLASLDTTGITIFGGAAGDQSGNSVSGAGDVNGDGYDDLFIGAFGASGSGEAQVFAGRSYVIFGGPAMPATIDLSNLGTAGITIIGLDANDQFGSSVSNAGDVNHDGFDDLLIGAQGGDGVDNLREDSGETYLIFGAASLPSTIDLASLGAAGITIYGADAFDGSGNSVSNAGDVNADGFDDLLIGAVHGDGAGNLKDDAGETYLIYGAATLPATIDLASLGTAGVTIYGADPEDLSASSISNAGDVNGDFFGDLIIGAYRGDGAGNLIENSGEAYLIFGGSALPATIDLASLGTAGVTLYGAESVDQCGISVANAGDINLDGFDDVLIGANKGDGVSNAKNGAGETYVVFGKAALTSTIELATLGSGGVTIFGATAADFSGGSVSNAGDANGDGIDDFLIGAGREELGGDGRLSAGSSYIIFGGLSLPTTIDLDTLDQAGIIIEGVDVGDRSGQSVSFVGDVNKDGFDDLLVGAIAADGANNLLPSAGESYLIYGNGNHHPVFTTPATLTIAENLTNVITVVATDVDVPAQTVTYSITGGVDQGLFTITSTGELVFKSAPDFEVPTDSNTNNIYNVQITADDGNGALTNQNIAVTVVGVNELPVFTSPGNFNVPENVRTVGTIVARDQDLPTQTVVYSISGGADQAKFSITSTGLLTFLTAPDFRTPTDIDANNIYEVQISANDGNGGVTVQSLAITVISVNLNAPFFISAATFSVPENTTAVGTVVATDADTPAQTIHYTLTGGADRARFAITDSGVLRFIAAPNFEIPTDTGTNNVYDVQVTASDGNGGLTVQSIAVTVTDVLDAPRLVFGEPAVTYTKGQAPVQIVPLITVTGTSTLTGGTLTISTTKKSPDKFTFPLATGLGSTSGVQIVHGQLTLRITLSSTATYSGIQTFLRGITFSTKGSGLNTALRSVDVTLAVNGELPATVRKPINVKKK